MCPFYIDLADKEIMQGLLTPALSKCFELFMYQTYTLLKTNTENSKNIRCFFFHQPHSSTSLNTFCQLAFVTKTHLRTSNTKVNITATHPHVDSSSVIVISVQT